MDRNSGENVSKFPGRNEIKNATGSTHFVHMRLSLRDASLSWIPLCVVVRMVRTLIAYAETLGNLPDNRFLSMQLLYRDEYDFPNST